MATTATKKAHPDEISILARVLENGQGRMPTPVARYLLVLEFSDTDKARMSELASRNQADALSEEEKEELFAYAKAGTLLSILKSRARRALRVSPK